MTEPRWMQIARAEIGVKEIKGDADNARIVEYHQSTSLHAKDDETPWCAAFVNWVLDQAKLGTTHRANARSFLSLPNKCEPVVGAIAILTRGNPKGPHGHVGFVVDSSPTMVVILGGNQGDAVSIQAFHRDRLIGCRWPDGPFVKAQPGV